VRCIVREWLLVANEKAACDTRGSHGRRINDDGRNANERRAYSSFVKSTTEDRCMFRLRLRCHSVLARQVASVRQVRVACCALGMDGINFGK